MNSTVLVPVVLSVLCLAFLALTLTGEQLESTAMERVAKPLASLCFIAIGVWALGKEEAPAAYGQLIVLGLVLGAIGDVALMFPSRKAFLAGLVSFLLGHVAYVVAFLQLASLGEQAHPAYLAPVVLGGGILAYLWPHLDKAGEGSEASGQGSMKGPVVAYVLTIVTMVVAAIAVFLAGSEGNWSEAQGQLLLVGALLFFISDVSVAQLRFVNKSFVTRLWGLPAYYAGQLCIAWTLLKL